MKPFVEPIHPIGKFLKRTKFEKDSATEQQQQQQEGGDDSNNNNNNPLTKLKSELAMSRQKQQKQQKPAAAVAAGNPRQEQESVVVPTEASASPVQPQQHADGNDNVDGGGDGGLLFPEISVSNLSIDPLAQTPLKQATDDKDDDGG